MDDLEAAKPKSKIEERRPSEATKKSFDRSFWEHPLTLLITGFVLTGVIGTLISTRIQEHDATRASEAQHYQSSTKAVTDLSDALYLRYVRAGMVKSALERTASPDEVRRRKELYDEALVKQESTAMSSFILIREALKRQDYDDWEARYDDAMKPLLSNLDSSLTKSTDEYLREAKDSRETPHADLSNLNYDYGDVRNCEYALVNGIFLTLSAKQYVTDAKRVIATQEEALNELQSRCQSTRPKHPAVVVPTP